MSTECVACFTKAICKPGAGAQTTTDHSDPEPTSITKIAPRDASEMYLKYKIAVTGPINVDFYLRNVKIELFEELEIWFGLLKHDQRIKFSFQIYT